MRAPASVTAAVACAALAALGCDAQLFDIEAPQGLVCGANDSCPPGQQCVPGEHVCRTPCVGVSTSMGPNTTSVCNNININGSGATGFMCDVDHYCRPMCGSGNSMCDGAGCPGGEMCDAQYNVCRKTCDSGCPSGWGCISFAIPGSGASASCVGCRPGASMGSVTPPMFADVAEYGTGAGAHTAAVAIGDLTGSGKPWIVAADGDHAHLYVYANNGDGTFAAPVQLPVSGEYAVAFADFTGDGKLDAVVAATNNPVLLPGNGDGTFGAAKVGPSVPSTDVVVGDFNGDGSPDAISSGSGTGQLSLVTGDGAGGLKLLTASGSPPQGPSYVQVVVGDFNNDKHADVAADNEHGGVDPFLNPGGSMFTFAQAITFNTQSRVGVAALDVDGDGRSDLAVVGKLTAQNNMFNYVVQVGLANQSGNSFTIPSGSGAGVNIPGAGTPGAFAAHVMAPVDLDGDGHTDLVISDSTSVANVGIHVLSNDGKGSLVLTKSVSFAGGATGVTTGDLDGDGKPDVVVGLPGSGGIAVLLNRTP